MGLDIVEIALDKLTDYQDFEKIATEIMRDEGYSNIKQLGGVADKGRDGICESYFLSEGRNISVFQYTVEEYLPGKIKDTIKKLRNAGIEFNELVIVTAHGISTERQDQMKREARKVYDVNLNIFDRKTLVNRLSKFENGIFYRHFPDIEKQIQILTGTQPILTTADAKALERAMLRSSLAFTLNKEATRVRDTIFDSLTISALLNSTDNEISVTDFHQKYSESVGMELETTQMEASLRRLISRGMISWQGNLIILTNFAKQSMSGLVIRANEATNTLILDLVDEISRITGGKLSAHDHEIISRNTRNVLIKLFQLFGMELANQVLKNATPSAVYLDASEELLYAARENLPQQIGEILIYALSQIIKNPTDEQAETLTNWSLAYLGVQIMNLDPGLRELQEMRFAKKMFILDTDFILDCIVQECPLSNVYLNLIKSVRAMGCRVIIPEYCIGECVKHAYLSPNTYYYFGDKLMSFSEPFIDELVWNVFVKGYYYARKNHKIPSRMSFERYLDNYYESTAKTPYMIEVIKNRLPEEIEIVDLQSLLEKDIPTERMSAMSEVFYELRSSSRKAEYRTDEEVKNLAETDASLFLTALYLNDATEGKPNEILGGCCYIITSSGKYLRSARKMKLKDVVTTRPQSLIAILDLIGRIDITPTEFVRLFENPFLIYAVRQAWEDVEVLLDSGIDLKDKSLPRLRWDLDQEMHDRISALREAERYAEVSGEEVPIGIGDKEYTELIKSASKRGYKKIPEVEAFMQALEAAEKKAEVKEEQYSELLGNYKNLEEEITHFGKRRQRYLKRIASRKQ